MSLNIPNIPSKVNTFALKVDGSLQTDAAATINISDDKIVAVSPSGAQTTLSIHSERVRKTQTRRVMIRSDVILAVPNADGGVRKLPLSVHTVITVPNETMKSVPLPQLGEVIAMSGLDVSHMLDHPAEIIPALVS
jgi:hypothetical protein